MKNRFHVLSLTAKEAVKRWGDQYGARSFKLADGRDAGEITRQLRALKRPTKTAVDQIIGDNDWTDIWCCVCHEYKPKVVSFGYDETAEVCEPCLRLALAALTRPACKNGEKS